MILRYTKAACLLLGAAHAAQPSAPSPPSAQLRPLPWGQLNFLHTTDTHGWHAGHLQEASYSADWGDYISFAQHLRDKADADGSDLLLVDSGDRIEGNGLYDASNPKGKYTFDIFTKQHMDIIVSGNHELYIADSSDNEYYTTVPAYKDSYIASNLDIYNPKTGKREALAPRFRKFTTKNQGIRITAFGFLFDFHGNANNTVVIPVEETIKQKWFQDAIQDREVDLFVVAGHVPVHHSVEYTAIYKAIRAEQFSTPIQFFGGHTHIRDYAIYDKASVGLESGRYMETIGFQSISGLSTPKETADSYAGYGIDPKARAKLCSSSSRYSRLLKQYQESARLVLEDSYSALAGVTAGILGRPVNGIESRHRRRAAATTSSPTFKRLYIDNNLFSLQTHSAKNDSTFATTAGRNVSKAITAARTELDLDKAFGCAPHDYWLNRAPYPANDSLLTWLDTEVLPWIGTNISAKSDEIRPSIVLTNSGAMRFDIFAGPFTIDSTYLVSPFTSGLHRLQNIPYSKANKILSLLNNQGQISVGKLLATDDTLGPEGLNGPAAQRMFKALYPPLAPIRSALQHPYFGLNEWRGDYAVSTQEPMDQFPPFDAFQQTGPHAAPRLQQPLSDTSTLHVTNDEGLTPGYITHDDASKTSPGDDTPHAPIKFYRVPNVIGSEVGVDEAHPPETVDLVYNAFIERWIVLALRYLGEGDRVKEGGEVVGDGRSLTEFMSAWIERHWPCPS